MKRVYLKKLAAYLSNYIKEEVMRRPEIDQYLLKNSLDAYESTESCELYEKEREQE